MRPRHALTDWALVKAISRVDAAIPYITTYDLMCSYEKKADLRLSKPMLLALSPDIRRIFATSINKCPTFHVLGHKADCIYGYGLPYTRGVGCLCGEGVETTWAASNPIGPSTRQMTAGSRHDALHAFLAGYVYMKECGFGEEMLD